MDIYEDPITLPCGHTFCRKCYTRYCEENTEATRRKCLQCPTCKQCKDVPNPVQMVYGSWNVADWVKPLKPSFIIRGLLDDFAAIVGKTEDDIKGKGKTRRNLRISSRKDKGTFYPKHKSELNYYCKKCQLSVCSDCAVQNHIRCGDVVQIDSLKPELKSILNNNLETLTHQMQNTEQWMKTVEHQIENLRRMESKVRENITSSCESAIRLIREWERKTLDELSGVIEQQVKELKDQLKSGDPDIQMFRQLLEFISRSLRDENEIDMTGMYEVCKSGEILNICQSRGKVRSTHDLVQIQLEKCFCHDEIQKNCHLGNLIVKRVKSSTIEVMTRQKSEALTASLHDTIDTRTSTDTLTPNLKDLCVVEVDGVEVVLVTDFNNNFLKSFYVDQNKPRVAPLKLSGNPFQVTRLCFNQVAVSIPLVNKIAIVKVTPHLTIQSTIGTDRRYLGLTSLDENTFAAGCESPPCVDILRGRVEMTISPDGSLIQSPRYLSTTEEGNILVSDKGSVVCLTPGGDVVFSIQFTSKYHNHHNRRHPSVLQ